MSIKEQWIINYNKMLSSYIFFTLFSIRAFFLGGYPAYANSSSVKSASVMFPFSSGPFLWNYIKQSMFLFIIRYHILKFQFFTSTTIVGKIARITANTENCTHTHTHTLCIEKLLLKKINLINISFLQW